MAASVFVLSAKYNVCRRRTLVRETICCCSKFLSFCHRIILCAKGASQARIPSSLSFQSWARGASYIAKSFT
ncbi:hypothetical protein HanPSC8_Chr03g0132821 [Helianthus annuus]|nr:hypothetical protein HanPSC8_Chr03g0132821 [Helianthus annuus]